MARKEYQIHAKDGSKGFVLSAKEMKKAVAQCPVEISKIVDNRGCDATSMF